MLSHVTRKSLHESIEKYFAQISGLRVTSRSSYRLVDIIAIAIFEILWGADNLGVIETTYGQVLCPKAKEEWLKTFLKLPNKIPSLDL